MVGNCRHWSATWSAHQLRSGTFTAVGLRRDPRPTGAAIIVRMEKARAIHQRFTMVAGPSPTQVPVGAHALRMGPWSVSFQGDGSHTATRARIADRPDGRERGTDGFETARRPEHAPHGSSRILVPWIGTDLTTSMMRERFRCISHPRVQNPSSVVYAMPRPSCTLCTSRCVDAGSCGRDWPTGVESTVLRSAGNRLPWSVHGTGRRSIIMATPWPARIMGCPVADAELR